MRIAVAVNYGLDKAADKVFKPCIRGTRITTGDILGWLAAGMSVAEIISDFPELNEVQIRAALTFTSHNSYPSQLVI
jgi:uncharacterized protein (DUF433 family)